MIPSHGRAAISVLIPVLFRQAGAQEIRLLRRALESVHDQRFPDGFEIVLVDDGSPTPVAEHAAALGAAASGVRFVRRARNQGITNALNVGLLAARYPLIARLDADDVWRAGKIEKQLALFAADPDLTITATGMVAVTPEGKTLGTHVRPAEWRGILEFLVDVGCPFPHGSVLARRDIYLALGGYPHLAGYASCEDFALWSLWLRFFKPRMVEEVLYDYTVSPSAISQLHGSQQALASDQLRRSFARLDLAKVLPAAMAEFAAVLGLSILEAGMLAWRIWRHGLPVRLPAAACGPLRAMMPDRDVECRDGEGVGEGEAFTPDEVLHGVRGGAAGGGDVIAMARPAR